MVGVRTLTLSFTLCLSAFFLASCGDGSNAKLLPVQDAGQIASLLDQIGAYADEGSCSTASEGTDKVLQRIDALPDSTDPELRQKLIEGAQSLQQLLNDPAGCTPASRTPSLSPPVRTTPTVTTTTTPTTTTSGGIGSGGSPAPGTTPAPDDTGGGTTSTPTTPEMTP